MQVVINEINVFFFLLFGVMISDKSLMIEVRTKFLNMGSRMCHDGVIERCSGFVVHTIHLLLKEALYFAVLRVLSVHRPMNQNRSSGVCACMSENRGDEI